MDRKNLHAFSIALYKGRVFHQQAIRKANIGVPGFFILPQVAKHFSSQVKKGQPVFPLLADVRVAIGQYFPKSHKATTVGLRLA